MILFVNNRILECFHAAGREGDKGEGSGVRATEGTLPGVSTGSGTARAGRHGNQR